MASENPEIEDASDVESSKEEEGLKSMMKDSVQKGMKSSQKEEKKVKNEAEDDNDMGDVKTYLEAKKQNEINRIQDIPGKVRRLFFRV